MGDHVSFRGEYEENEKGGVIHWTHRDPGGSELGVGFATGGDVPVR